MVSATAKGLWKKIHVTLSVANQGTFASVINHTLTDCQMSLLARSNASIDAVVDLYCERADETFKKRVKTHVAPV